MIKKYFFLFVTLVCIVPTGFGQTTTLLDKTYSNKTENTTRSNLSTIVDNTNYKTGAPEFNSGPEYINSIDASSTSVGKFIPMKIRILDGNPAFLIGSIERTEKITTITQATFDA